MPRGRERIDCQCPGPGLFSVQMPGGVPGGMVRVGIERDIKRNRQFLLYVNRFTLNGLDPIEYPNILPFIVTALRKLNVLQCQKLHIKKVYAEKV